MPEDALGTSPHGPPTAPAPGRTVAIESLFDWLPRRGKTGAVATVLPDAAELGLPEGEWVDWYLRAAALCMEASAGPTVFLATDRKAEGRWRSKPKLIERAAGGRPLLWHKIVLRRGVGQVDLHRPTYSHLLAYGPGRPGPVAPDVMEHGRQFWRNGIGVAAARYVALYLKSQQADVMLNPCCGVGTLLAAANAVGLTAHGCDIDEGRAAEARSLHLE